MAQLTDKQIACIATADSQLYKINQGIQKSLQDKSITQIQAQNMQKQAEANHKAATSACISGNAISAVSGEPCPKGCPEGQVCSQDGTKCVDSPVKKPLSYLEDLKKVTDSILAAHTTKYVPSLNASQAVVLSGAGKTNIPPAGYGSTASSIATTMSAAGRNTPSAYGSTKPTTLPPIKSGPVATGPIDAITVSLENLSNTIQKEIDRMNNEITAINEQQKQSKFNFAQRQYQTRYPTPSPTGGGGGATLGGGGAVLG